jgi:putative glutathione S-transferase
MPILSLVQIPTRFTNPSMSRISTSKPNETTAEGTSCDPAAPHGYFVSLYDRCRFTVPVLWDKKLQTIVNNESSEIIRMFNVAFNEFIPAEKAALDFYPVELRAEIDAVNEWIYPNINSVSM